MIQNHAEKLLVKIQINHPSNPKINNAKSNSNNEMYFVFKVTVHPKDNVDSANSNEVILVDCGATTHIIYE